MNGNKWGIEFDFEQRIRLKKLALVLGLLLILFLIVGRLSMKVEEEVPVHVPIIRTIENVWIMEASENRITVFEEGEIKQYEGQPGYLVDMDAREQLADVILADEKMISIRCKTDKINGKVLAVNDTEIGIEGYGNVSLSESAKGYKLYGSMEMCTVSDLLIGYDYADFVIEDGRICGILLMKEDIMEYIRVLIKTSEFQEILHSELVITSDSDYRIQYGPFEQPVEELYHAGDVCVVDLKSNYFEGNRILIEPLALSGKVKLVNVKRNQESVGYRGKLELIKTADGIVVINEVLLEEYLYSVVPSEMPASYPVEALKAQAICARTYAYRYLHQAGYSEYGAHVDDSTGYQVYNNIMEQEATTTAVKETFGKILTWGDTKEPAQTYYYSTSCGIGTDAGIWKVGEDDLPTYLTSLPINQNTVTTGAGDTTIGKALREESNFAEFITSRNADDYEAEESWYRWTYAVDQIDCQGIKERLISRHNVDSSRVLVLQEDNRVSGIDDADAVFTTGTIDDFSMIYDMYISCRGTGGVASELIIQTDKGTYKVLTEYNIRYVLCDGKSKVQRQDHTVVSAVSLLPSGFFVMDSMKDGKNVSGYVLSGGGYGHGVGMSQNGAGRMAQKGLSAEEIVSFFYQGCTIQNVYKKGQ